MCGIIGLVDHLNEVSTENFIAARDLMSNRGPDDQGLHSTSFSNGKVLLGHRRLSIIDLSAAGKQPFISADGNMIITFNGELYNYLQIRGQLQQEGISFLTETDTEVVIRAIEHWGIDAVKRFIGMFAFALLNVAEQRLHLCRDRVGVKPLYIAHLPDQLLFASDLRSVLALKGKSLIFNESCVASYLKYGYVNSHHSLVKGVQRLEPGTVLEYDLQSKQHRSIRYWNPLDYYPIDRNTAIHTEEQVIEQLEEILTSAFSYRMVSDVPVGVFLSGGYDSSIVCALLSQKAGNTLNTFTIGFEDSRYDESEYADAVAAHLGLNHHQYTCTESDAMKLVEKLVDIYDEPLGDPSAIPTTLVSQLASKSVKVVLSADGADELFGGYEHYTRSLYGLKKVNAIPGFLKQMTVGLPDDLINALLSPFARREMGTTRVRKLKKMLMAKSYLEFSDALNSVSDNVLTSTDSLLNRNGIEQLALNRLAKIEDEIEKMFLFDYQNYLEGDLLKKVDRATMYCSIEGREPFLDQRIFEFMAKLPSDLKINQSGVKKYLLKKIAHRYLPQSLMDRPKMGFSLPIHQWFQKDGPLHQLLFDTLSPEALASIEVIDGKKVEKLIRQYLRDGTTGFQTLWNLFNLIRWKQTYC